MILLRTIAVAGLGAALSACASSPATKPATGAASPPPSSSAAGQVAGLVNISENPTQGSILVDGDGRTLYLFERDRGTQSACLGACAQVWPAFTANGVLDAGNGVDRSKLATASGQVSRQVIYYGHLLYRY